MSDFKELDERFDVEFQVLIDKKGYDIGTLTFSNIKDFIHKEIKQARIEGAKKLAELIKKNITGFPMQEFNGTCACCLQGIESEMNKSLVDLEMELK